MALEDKDFAKHAVPFSGDYLVDIISTVVSVIGLDILPLPARSLTGTMPFDPKAGIGQKRTSYGVLCMSSSVRSSILCSPYPWLGIGANLSIRR